jgi:hypothetical protein
MTLKDIIEGGYFPKELSPPFNTVVIAKYISAILANWTTIYFLNF